MMTSKDRKSKLMRIADEVIRNSRIYKDGMIISESYNGQIAAFSVSVALSGLKPTMAVYNSESSNAEVDKSKIIDLLRAMCEKDRKLSSIIAENDLKDKNTFYFKIIETDGENENEIRRCVIEYAIALKLAIRTFKFKKK